jgi:hypothetical protein
MDAANYKTSEGQPDFAGVAALPQNEFTEKRCNLK